MKSFEEIRELLSQKFSKEKKRLKTFGTKTSSFDLANAVARYVEGMRTDARYGELIRLQKHIDKEHIEIGKRLKIYIQDRIHGTEVMAKTFRDVADQTEKARPWRSKTEQAIDRKEKKERKERHKHKHHHEHKRRARSSRH